MKEKVSPDQPRLSLKVDNTAKLVELTAHSTHRPSSASRPSSTLSSRTRLSVRVNQSPKHVHESPVTSPKHQPTIEETLGFWTTPHQNREASHVVALTIENRLNDLHQHFLSLPMHERQREANVTDDDGNPVLFHALAPTHTAVLSLLLDYGADVSALNDKRNTALHIACYFQHKRAMQTLVEFGANLKAENWEHQQCHQMQKTSDKIQQTQTYLNQVWEAHSEKLASKYARQIDPSLRCYWRSLFDVGDEARIGAIPYAYIAQIVNKYIAAKQLTLELEIPIPIVRVSAVEREKVKEKAKIEEPASGEPNWALLYFSNVDADHNGSLNFPEFINIMVSLSADEQASLKKVASKSKKKGKKKP